MKRWLIYYAAILALALSVKANGQEFTSSAQCVMEHSRTCRVEFSSAAHFCAINDITSPRNGWCAVNEYDPRTVFVFTEEANSDTWSVMTDSPPVLMAMEAKGQNIQLGDDPCSLTDMKDYKNWVGRCYNFRTVTSLEVQEMCTYEHPCKASVTCSDCTDIDGWLHVGGYMPQQVWPGPFYKWRANKYCPIQHEMSLHGEQSERDCYSMAVPGPEERRQETDEEEVEKQWHGASFLMPDGRIWPRDREDLVYAGELATSSYCLYSELKDGHYQHMYCLTAYKWNGEKWEPIAGVVHGKIEP